MSSESIGPEAHSNVVGGSSASRRINCKASLFYQSLGVIEEPPSEEALRGSAMHEAMAMILDDPDVELKFPFRYERDGHVYELEEDDWKDQGDPSYNALQDMLDDLEEEVDEDAEYLVETRVDFPNIEGAFGTADLIVSCGEITCVWDWKFGEMRVDAQDNQQLMFYAAAAASTRPDLFGAKSLEEIDPDRIVRLYIMQPKNSMDPSQWTVAWGDIAAFIPEMEKAVKEGLSVDGKDRASGLAREGDWCEFAPCKAFCPKFADALDSIREAMSEAGVNMDDPASQEAIDDVTNDDKDATGEVMRTHDWVYNMPAILDRIDRARAWFKVMESYAIQLMADGHEIEGWMIKARTGHRKWEWTEDEICGWLNSKKIPMDEYMPRKLLTPAKAEALLKRLKKKGGLPDGAALAPTLGGFNLKRDDGTGDESTEMTVKKIADLSAPSPKGKGRKKKAPAKTATKGAKK